MKKLILLPLTLSLLVGCARFQTKQTDIVTSKDGAIASRTTEASAVTFLDSKSQLSQFKAMQSDKTQTATVGGLAQESTSTNMVQSLANVAEIIKALKTP